MLILIRSLLYILLFFFELFWYNACIIIKLLFDFFMPLGLLKLISDILIVSKRNLKYLRKSCLLLKYHLN